MKQGKKLFLLAIVLVSAISKGCLRLHANQRNRGRDAADYHQRGEQYERAIELRKEILLRNGVRNTLKCAPGCCLASCLCCFSIYNLCNLKADCTANSVYCTDSYRSDLLEIFQGAGLMCVSACGICDGWQGCQELCESNVCYEKNCCKKCCNACVQECGSLAKEAPSALISCLKDFFLGD